MKGHTSNRILRATLQGMTRTADSKIAEARKVNFQGGVDYWQGYKNALGELGTLLYIDE